MNGIQRQCQTAKLSCENAVAALVPLVFRHKKDFGELQIGLNALAAAVEALEAASRAEPEGYQCGQPADCLWPLCTCDPAAGRVIDALRDKGLLIAPGGIPREEPQP